MHAINLRVDNAQAPQSIFKRIIEQIGGGGRWVGLGSEGIGVIEGRRRGRVEERSTKLRSAIELMKNDQS